MTLPYAERPDESNVYRTLSSKQVKTLGARDFDIVREPIYTDYPNEDEFRRLGLVARNAGMAQGGPALSNSAATFGIALQNNEAYIRIPEGQVWSLVGYHIAALATGTGLTLETSIVSFDPNYGDDTRQKMSGGDPLSPTNQAFGTSNYNNIVLQETPLLLPSGRLIPFAQVPSDPLVLTYPFAVQFKHINYSSGATQISGYMNRLR
jgi:hypothetical protein